MFQAHRRNEAQDIGNQEDAGPAGNQPEDRHPPVGRTTRNRLEQNRCRNISQLIDENDDPNQVQESQQPPSRSQV
jgi:hypothetical protein